MRRLALLLAMAALAALAGCGGSDGGGKDKLIVSAASSLKAAFPKYEPDARYSFAGSDELAAQIRAGQQPDVFASANTKLPSQLHSDGLVEKPVIFASNRLVVAVPAGSTKVKKLADLGRRGVTIAAGSANVPIGAYTREVIGRFPVELAGAIAGNIRSNEPDVAGVVGKLTQGAVDAGFVYVTDVRATGGKLRAIPLPDRLQPQVQYAAAVVVGSKRAAKARKFVVGLLGGDGKRALGAAGFEAP